MARKKRPAKPTVGHDSRFAARLQRRAGKVLRNITLIYIFQILLELFQNCPNDDPATITSRIANAGPLRQWRMARRLKRRTPGMGRDEAFASIDAIVSEAQENPNDTAKMVVLSMATIKAAMEEDDD